MHLHFMHKYILPLIPTARPKLAPALIPKIEGQNSLQSKKSLVENH